jgi:hypothetical protein
MEECTFKPKLQTNSYHTNRDVIRADEQVPRYDILHKKGTQMISTRKDKTKDEVEAERNEKELRFKPDLEK